MNFTEDQIERYSRHFLLQEVGIEGQTKINQAKVLVIGAGGLGAPVALYLASAGVGKIGIVDGDVVDLSNLQRQVIHATKDVGTPKVDSAYNSMIDINPDIEVVKIPEFVRADNICDIIREWDFVIDGTDSFGIKFLINDACIMEKKPFSHAGILRFDGQTTTVKPYESSCYRCTFIEPPPLNAVPSCSQAGVLGAIAGVIGTIQATEALKFITGIGNLLYNRLLVFDAKEMSFRNVNTKRKKTCAICGDSPTITSLEEVPTQVCDLKLNK